MMDWNRRTILKTLGGGAVPSLRLVPEGAPAGPAKFTVIDLAGRFTCSPSDFGPQPRAGGAVRLPSGQQALRGIPFLLGPEGPERKSWIALSRGSRAWAAPSVEIGIDAAAQYLCLAQFCDWDENEIHPADPSVIERVGQTLAEAVLVYEDAPEVKLPIRRRFEVSALSTPFGHQCFAAISHPESFPRKLSDPLPNGKGWGGLQSTVWDMSGDPPLVWLCALPNPQPERKIRSLRLEAAGANLLMVCGLTLCHGAEHPLRRERRALYRITLPEPSEESQWKVSVDLGVVARTYTLPPFEPGQWLHAPDAGLGERHKRPAAAPCLYAEVSANRGATLTLHNNRSGASWAFDLSNVAAGRDIVARPDAARVEVLESHKTWLHGTVVEKGASQPIPVRIAFRSEDGRYIPPYGHRTEINDAFFQDYGADLKLLDSSFAYVDGTFQVELPVGAVYVELSKGFEYEAVRQRLAIRPGQRELRLEIPRHTNLRAKGWVTADTHVHFLSPSTAMLESQAEGLNLVNLLAAQWGDLFTNVGDLAHGPLISPDRETIVWPGTENRQHLLGHLGLLGGHGHPVYPMSAAGPGEAYFGDPLWSSIADWAEACRKREGIAVAPHFPYPTGEIAADIVLGKIDAVELPFRDGVFDTLRFNDWYRYLNCGYRVPAVGGTDKMGAYMPAGAARTYAWIGAGEFSFAAWADAVRRGRTFTTTGPLLLFEAAGAKPGDEIAMRPGGGTVEARVEALSFVPFHRVELVWNGNVVASRDEPAGTRRLVLEEKVKVPGSGWLAARCSSTLGPTTSWSLAIAAHTSPVYFRVPGDELFSAPAAAYFLTLVDGAELWVRSLATRPPDAEGFDRTLKTLSEARERLHRRLHGHS